MKCPKCDCEKIQFVGNTYTKRKNVSLGEILIAIGLILMLLSFSLLFRDNIESQNTIEETVEYLATNILIKQVAMVFFSSGVNIFIAGIIINVLKPYKIETTLNAVCSNCGHTWPNEETEDKSENDIIHLS